VVNSYGRVTGSLPLGAEGVLDASLPVAISPPIYTKLGSGAPLVMVLVCLSVVLMARRRRVAYPAST
jgi:apolipoprotein N-acyltransferase